MSGRRVTTVCFSLERYRVDAPGGDSAVSAPQRKVAWLSAAPGPPNCSRSGKPLWVTKSTEKLNNRAPTESSSAGGPRDEVHKINPAAPGPRREEASTPASRACWQGGKSPRHCPRPPRRPQAAEAARGPARLQEERSRGPRGPEGHRGGSSTPAKGGRHQEGFLLHNTFYC